MITNRTKANAGKLMLLFAGAFSLVSTANADPVWPMSVKAADIPFAFRIGNNTLPAGKYRLEQWASGSPSYYLKNVQTGKFLLVTRRPGNGDHPMELNFEKDKSGYVLKNVR